MLLPSPLYAGRLIKRYQRFLADVLLESGETVTAHCPNSGSMKGCALPGSAVFLSRSANPKRKLAYTWELVEADGVWAGINTALPNRIVHEAIAGGEIPELAGYSAIRPEVPYGTGSRIDLLLSGDRPPCYVEVKNVTLVEGGQARFPDAVTTRGQKHLRELMEVVRKGERGVIFFLVQRPDGATVAPADDIDPEYGRLLRLAAASGVEPLAYRAEVTPEQVRIACRLPIILD
jgi:sugar fermentation stimulation protein A